MSRILREHRYRDTETIKPMSTYPKKKRIQVGGFFTSVIRVTSMLNLCFVNSDLR